MVVVMVYALVSTRGVRSFFSFADHALTAAMLLSFNATANVCASPTENVICITSSSYTNTTTCATSGTGWGRPVRCDCGCLLESDLIDGGDVVGRDGIGGDCMVH